MTGSPTRVLIAGVGYPFLHDWSVGTRVAAELKERAWPPGVDVDDWSFGPLDAVHKLQGADPPYDRVVFFGAVLRDRPGGTVVRRQWHMSELPPPDEIQTRFGEGLAGVIGLDNLVIVCGALKALPDDVVLLEVEPVDEMWGDGYSAEVEASLPQLLRYIDEEAATVAVAAAGPTDDQI